MTGKTIPLAIIATIVVLVGGMYGLHRKQLQPQPFESVADAIGRASSDFRLYVDEYSRCAWDIQSPCNHATLEKTLGNLAAEAWPQAFEDLLSKPWTNSDGSRREQAELVKQIAAYGDLLPHCKPVFTFGTKPNWQVDPRFSGVVCPQQKKQ